jgi:hypothetical protein
MRISCVDLLQLTPGGVCEVVTVIEDQVHLSSIVPLYSACQIQLQYWNGRSGSDQTWQKFSHLFLEA